MITITVVEFVKFSKVNKDWIISKCRPVGNALANRGLHNLYDAEDVLLRAKKNLQELEANHSLAASQRARAIQKIKKIISGVETFLSQKKLNTKES